MDRHHFPTRPHRAPDRAPDRDRLTARKGRGGEELRLAGRLDPAAMFPAGESAVRTHCLTLRSGLRLRIAESGARGAPPVLLLHGWGASLYMWRGWFAALADAGHHAVAVDLPGHGLSDKPDDAATYRLEAIAAVVREVIALEGLAQVDLVAQSMAGTIAIELALQPASGIRRTVVVNPSCFGHVRLQRLARAVSPSLVDVVLPRLVARWVIARAHRMVYGDPSRITPRDEDEYWAPSQFPSYARAMRLLLHEFPWSRPPADAMAARLRALRTEMLVVLGSRDRLVRDARSYATALCAAGAPLEVHEIPEGGHAVNEERPEEVIALVLEFLRRAR